jgi:hypothetical protein
VSLDDDTERGENAGMTLPPKNLAIQPLVALRHKQATTLASPSFTGHANSNMNITVI